MAVLVATAVVLDRQQRDDQPAPRPVETTTTTTAGPRSGALVALDTVAIKGRAPKTGYDRGAFGPAWRDVDHNGCDTRNDILARDLLNPTLREGTQDCVVVAGTLLDPYDGATILFAKADAAAVQIDHVVALSDAWQKGAQLLTPEARALFANDPINLLAVGRSLNASKGDGDVATWLPPRRGYRCEYVARVIAVKVMWHLWMTPAEAAAARRVLAKCPGEPLPSSANA